MSEFRQPFAEMLDALETRLENLIPTERWTDLMRNAHDRGFTVAGATEADLLADLAEAVSEFITDGKGIESFREAFDEIVEQYGWDYVGERNWRTRVIYQTNMATSYAAGRYAQLTDPDLLAVAPFRMYRHGGSSDPRPHHVAWDGLVLPADDPFWDTHMPPNGWGCSCYVIAVSAEQAERLGGRFETPPEDPPGAIDEGWDYTPGKDVGAELRELVDKKTDDLPFPLDQAFADRMRDRGNPP